MVAPVDLQVTEEAQHDLEGQIIQAQLGDLGPLLLGQEAEQEPHGVPIAAHRCGPQALHRHQMVDEERMHQRPQGPSRVHAWTASVGAKASNRWLACPSSAGVIVK